MHIQVWSLELGTLATLDTEEFIDIPVRGGRHYRLIEEGSFARLDEIQAMTVEGQRQLDLLSVS